MHCVLWVPQCSHVKVTGQGQVNFSGSLGKVMSYSVTNNEIPWDFVCFCIFFSIFSGLVWLSLPEQWKDY